MAWDLAFGALALVYLAIGVSADEGNAPSTAVLALLAAVFLAEFAARMYDAPSRYGYLRQHWLDLVSAIPLVGGLRSLRLLRLLRLGAAIRVLSTAEDAARRRGGRHSMWYLGPALAVIWFSAAAAYYVVEEGANHAVRSFGDALYWAFATATTVGYGAPEPVTPGGHVVAGALILVSIGLVGVISSRLVFAWLGADDPVDAGEDPVEQRLERLEQAVLRVELLLQSTRAVPVADGASALDAGTVDVALIAPR